MQNRNNTIEERLQIINDYIQRTMDALNATRQVVQGLSNTTTNYSQNVVPQNVPGLNHSSFVPQNVAGVNNFVPQFVQTPYGIVAINAQVPQVPQVPQVQLGYGFQHSSFVPQLQGWGMNVVPQVVNQLGIPQVVNQLGVPQVGVVGNYGWPTGLNHTQFVQGPVSPWGVPMVQQWPINQAVGFNQQLGFNQVGMNQVGVNPQHVVQQGVPTQTF